MQWFVIAVLVIGGGIAVYMLINKNNELQTQTQNAQGNMDSLKNQLKEAKASPTISVTPLPEAKGNLASPTPTPKANATPTPKTTSTPKL